jgi:hypothetical protein
MEVLKNNSTLEDFEFVAIGRLHKGRLDGFVVMQGMVSNDPKGLCSSYVLPGFSFLGHFKSGKPHGVCWKELLGGSAIYGKVNEDGHFTGAKPLMFLLWLKICFCNL